MIMQRCVGKKCNGMRQNAEVYTVGVLMLDWENIGCQYTYVAKFSILAISVLKPGTW